MVGSALRTFLYLDTGLVNDFLASVEGGVYQEERLKESGSRTKGLSFGAGAAGLRAGVDTGKGTSTESERTFVLTDGARFNRLYEYLRDDDALSYFSGFSDETWGAIGRGTALECDVTLTLSPLDALGSLMSGLGDIAAALQSTGTQLVDTETQTAMAGLAALMNTGGKGTLVKMSLVDSPEYALVGRVLPQFLLVETTALDGDATVVCKVQRLLRTGQSIPLSDLVTLMDKLGEKSGQPEQFPSELVEVVHPPAAVVTPIAIFR